MAVAETPLDIGALQAALREFARERDWEQFHGPKNLAMGLAIESAEVMEIFQWLDPAESARIMADPQKANAAREELADVFLYVLRLADVLAVDLGEAARAKLAKNAAKYPVHLAKGNARKYSDFDRAPDRQG